MRESLAARGVGREAVGVSRRGKRRVQGVETLAASRRSHAAPLAAMPAEIGVLTIAARAEDTDDPLAAPRREEAHLLIRATHQRRIADTEDGEAAYVWSTLATAPVAGTLTVQLQRTP